MKSWRTLLVFLLVTVGGGLLVGATNLPGSWYEGLNKPFFTPPNWVFGPAWTILYVLIAIAGWRVWNQAAEGLLGAQALKWLWITQLVLNFAWSPLVFTLHQLAAGLVAILLMLGVILVFIATAWRVEKLSAGLFIPYAMWVMFAAGLNAGLLYLN